MYLVPDRHMPIRFEFVAVEPGTNTHIYYPENRGNDQERTEKVGKQGDCFK